MRRSIHIRHLCDRLIDMANENGRARTAAARASRTRAKHDRWMAELREAGRLDELLTVALKNYAWMSEHRNAWIDWQAETLVDDNGGSEMSLLLDAGFTPATRA